MKKQRYHFADKGQYNQNYGFPDSHVWMWELNHKEGWPPKNWCLLTVVLVKTQESLRLQGDKDFLKEINPEYLLEGLMLKLNLQSSGYHIWKRPWSWERLKEQEEKGMTEDEMVGWHHWLNWDMNLSKLWEIGKDREARCAAVHEVAKSWTQLSNWTSINTICIIYMHMYVHIYMNKCIIYLSHAPLHFKQYSIQPSSSLSTDPRSLSYYDLNYRVSEWWWNSLSHRWKILLSMTPAGHLLHRKISIYLYTVSSFIGSGHARAHALPGE